MTAVVERLDWDSAPEGVFRLIFHCPGCGLEHGPWVGPKHVEADQRWSWNGSLELPVFKPSLKVTWDHMSDASRARNASFFIEHGRYMTHEELPFDEHHVCHSYVGCNGALPGQIIFLNDCTHALAGQVVDLPPCATPDSSTA